VGLQQRVLMDVAVAHGRVVRVDSVGQVISKGALRGSSACVNKRAISSLIVCTFEPTRTGTIHCAGMIVTNIVRKVLQ